VGFGLSLMGWFEIRIPGDMNHYLDQKARNAGGIVGVILMGIAYTMTSLTCTVQFVGTVLIVASQGHWLWPLVGMLLFSTTFAAPFFLLALFPQKIQFFQNKSGVWLLQLKFILGIIELGLAMKFFSNADLVWQLGLLSRDWMLGIWIVLCAVIASFLLGAIPINSIQPPSRKMVRYVSSVLPILGVIYLGQGWLGYSLDGWTESFLPPPLVMAATDENITRSGSLQEGEENLVWIDRFEAARKQALVEGKPLFIDFTGYTCINCRWMEKNIFPHPKIQEKFSEHFVLTRLYVDGGEQEEFNRNLLVERFHTLALPTYVILHPNGEFVAQYSGITSSPEAFLTFLEQAEQ